MSTPSDRQRLPHRVHQADIGEGVAHQPADQELHRQVIDPLVALLVGASGRVDPAVDHAVAHHLDGGCQPVVTRGDRRLLADAVFQAFDDFRRQLEHINLSRGGMIGCGSSGQCHNAPGLAQSRSDCTRAIIQTSSQFQMLAD
jgi:hypothetical protein